jgi:hypothetical protein
MSKETCKACPFKLAMEFKRPTEQEVSDYAKSIGWPNFDAAYFIAKQEQTGWITVLGKQVVPIANWKGTVMIWFISAKKRGEIKEVGKSFKDMYESTKPDDR